MGVPLSKFFESSSSSSSSSNNGPFSFTELQKGVEVAIPDPVFVDASDGVKLAVRIFRPTKEPISNNNDNDKTNHESSVALVFYHGGGAHSAAGYQNLGKGLAEDYGATVYLPDIRGHGCSEGPRGDAPSEEQVWSDVDTVLDFVGRDTQQAEHQHESSSPPCKLYLGGHSSGGGLVVNYASWAAAGQNNSDNSNNRNRSSMVVSGHVLVSPQLGHESGTLRPLLSGRTAFATVSVLPFVLNGIFGVLGSYPAVRFGYPPEVLERDPGLVAHNTVTMAKAITPTDPGAQIDHIIAGGKDDDSSSSPPPPIGLWIGADDELFLPEKVVDFVPNTNNNGQTNVGIVVPDQNHLSILLRVHEHIGPWMTTTTTTNE